MPWRNESEGKRGGARGVEMTSTPRETMGPSPKTYGPIAGWDGGRAVGEVTTPRYDTTSCDGLLPVELSALRSRWAGPSPVLTLAVR